jgi:hypothetical protein
MSRIVCWFSCGAASAVATKLAITENAGRLPLVVAYTEVVNEHPDNKRFLSECREWFGQDIQVLRNEVYGGDIMRVFRKKRFIVGPQGAPCSRELKRWVRVLFEQEDDIQVFGFTSDERHRAERFASNNAYLTLKTPLIERDLNKSDCQSILWAAGIKRPAMYDLGFRNNNCVGCVKGGMGYWNRIRVHFPDRFAEMARLEREIGASINHTDSGPVYLDELDPARGIHEEEPDIECGVFCQLAIDEIKGPA